MRFHKRALRAEVYLVAGLIVAVPAIIGGLENNLVALPLGIISGSGVIGAAVLKR